MTIAGGQSTGSGTSGFASVVLPLQALGNGATTLNGYGSFAYALPLVMGSKVASTSVTGTSEATLQGTLTGTDTIGLGEARVGMTVVGTFRGILSTDGSPGTVTVRVKINGSTQLTLTSTTLPNTATNVPVEGEFMMTIRTLGATGTAFIQGSFENHTSNVDQIWQGQTTATFTIDTTADSTFDVTAQFSDTGNTLTITNGLLILYPVG
jgi:hypothetical protein